MYPTAAPVDATVDRPVFRGPTRLVLGLVVFALAVCLSGRAVSAQPDAAPTATPVPVMQPAGVIPSTITLNVTGAPADGAFLNTLIQNALDRVIRPTLRPGAAIRYGAVVPWPIPPLGQGERAAVNVSVTLAGSYGNVWVNGTTTVNLFNITTPPLVPSVLYLSDDPEYIRTEGLVYRGAVEAGRPARLYYYHDDIGLPRDLDVVLTAAVPSRVHIVQSSGGPDLDVMSVGHVVSRDFLLAKEQNEGFIADLVPGVPFTLRHDLILQGELVAGAVDLQVLDGGPISASVVASPAGGHPDTYLNGPRLGFDGHNRHGAFLLDGYGELSGAYTVGGPDVAVKYGGINPTPRTLDATDTGHDYGDYGVVHKIVFQMSNPTDVPSSVYLYEKPLGGPVRSSFIVDGQLKEVGCARLQQPYWFMTYQLPPHGAGSSTTLTMTDGGSFYPLEFGVTGTMPQPITPPVGTPEGCSPVATPAPAQTASPAPPPAPSPEPSGQGVQRSGRSQARPRAAH